MLSNMENIFHWVRRRRLVNEKLPHEDSSSIEFSNIRCTCKGVVEQWPAVTEIVLANDVTCILMEDGLSFALDRATHEKLCVLNSSPLFAVRSICYNSWNDTIIIVWNSKLSNHGLSISVLDRHRVKNGDATPIQDALELQSLAIPHPGFVEFEEPNGRIVTSTPHDNLFRFWNMETYEVVFTMPNTEYKEIRISKGTVAFFRQPKNNILPVKLCSIVTGAVLADTEIELHPNRELRFLELCGCYLLVKQDDACIRVHDLLQAKGNRMRGTKHFLPRAVTFFTGENGTIPHKPSKAPTSFLAVHSTSMEICSCIGGELVSLAKILTQPPKSPADCLQVIQNKEVLLVYNSGESIARFSDEISLDHHYPIKHDSHTTMNINTQNMAQRNEILTTELFSQSEKCINDRVEENLLDYEKDILNQETLTKSDIEESTDSIGFSKASSLSLTCSTEQQTHHTPSSPGVSVISLRTGRVTMFIHMDCEIAVNVLLYDPIQKEILAGGSKGLHRLRTTFEELRDDIPTELSTEALFSTFQRPFSSLRNLLPSLQQTMNEYSVSVSTSIEEPQISNASTPILHHTPVRSDTSDETDYCCDHYQAESFKHLNKIQFLRQQAHRCKNQRKSLGIISYRPERCSCGKRHLIRLRHLSCHKSLTRSNRRRFLDTVFLRSVYNGRYNPYCSLDTHSRFFRVNQSLHYSMMKLQQRRQRHRRLLSSDQQISFVTSKAIVSKR